MANPAEIVCDGCGQPADQEHIARRLKRLENMTRYRPIHIQALFLGVAGPADDRDHLYSAEGKFQGEGAEVLEALGIEPSGRSVAGTLHAFQRAGFLLTHVLECPVADAATRKQALQKRLPATLVKIRRSYKPKRVALVGAELAEFVTQVSNAQLDSILLLQNGLPCEWNALSADLLAKVATAQL